MLTFQSIRDVERAERDSKKLQRLPDNWHLDLAEYLRMKEDQTDKSPEDLLEIQNVKGIIQRLLDLREKKIMDQTLITVRTGAPPENLLKNEEEVFWSVVESLKRFRTDFMPTNFSKKFDQKVGGTKAEVLGKYQPEGRRYKVKKSFGPFVGPDMKTYSLKEGEVVSLPPALVAILENKAAIQEGA